MKKIPCASARNVFRASALSAAVASALLLSYSGIAASAPMTVKGVVAGSYFTPPVNSDNPALAAASSTAASVYHSVKVCVDLNDNAACDSGEPFVMTKSDGSFLLASKTSGPLAAEISTASTNGGHVVTQRNVFRVAADQIAAVTTSPLVPANIAVTPLSTEAVRMMEDGEGNFYTVRQNLASRLGVTTDQVLSDPNKIADPVAQSAVLEESVILTNRFGFAAKMVDRGDVASVPAAQQAAMNIEGIPRYDNIFIIMLENKATSSIKGSVYAPKINGWLNAGNQFVSYFATGNPSEPNYTALGGADDFGITDDNQWNCGATGANALQDLVIPTNSVPGLGSSPFTNPCNQATNHNIVGKPNLFNALTSNGMTWRTYSESMNPGQDFRTDSVGDPGVYALDNVYPPGTLGNNASQIGNPALQLPLPASLYKTKHHPGMAYQNVRSAVEFSTSNRTLGGGQWDAVLLSSTKYTPPANYNIDQFSSDLQSGDVGHLNFLMPDQCDDMHGITLQGKVNGVGSNVTASDCTGSANITRGDNYTDNVIKKIQASPLWNNPNKRVAIVIMFDEGTATAGFNSCCGWNSDKASTPVVVNPLKQNPDGSFSPDTSIVGYQSGNRGHGESVFGVLTNQPNAPKGIVDSDYYSHFSFVRTLQDMFGLSDPAAPGSYMNRSKYTESFIAANILNLPEFQGSADTHFDSVRPMNHAYVFPAGTTHKQSTDVTGSPQVGPDATQTNLWSLK